MRPFLAALAAALVLTIAAPLPAQAAPRPDQTGRLLQPDRRFGGVSGGDATGEGWVSTLGTPADELGPRCLELGRRDEVLLALGTDTAPRCRVDRYTAIYVLGLTQVCFAPAADRVTPAEQRRCALDGLWESAGSVPVVFTVDGRRVADLKADRYLVCSPQRRFQAPAGNIFDASPGPSTLTACGWVAWLVDLPPGRHLLRTTAKDHEWSVTVTVTSR